MDMSDLIEDMSQSVPKDGRFSTVPMIEASGDVGPSQSVPKDGRFSTR